MNDVATGTDRAKVQTRTFVGRRAELDEVTSTLTIESQAALRQFSLERLMGYGVDYADAIELRARVLDGQLWQDAATAVAQACLDRVSASPEGFGTPTRVVYLRRASALTRMSQVMMLSDTAERREIYRRAADLYAQAADLAGDREQLAVETDEGTLAGWAIPAGENAVASAVVIGGVEGWAMDFDSTGVALAERGVDAFMLDGPGQGESRMSNGVYLTAGWLDAYRHVIDELDRRAPGRPIAVIGNSMGGSFMMALAAADPRIAACCNNGGIPAPGLIPPSIGTFFTKMMAFCASDDAEETSAIWGTVNPVAEGPNAGYPLLVVHGGKDPLVSDDRVDMLVRLAPTDDQEMVVFSDGDHCIYNHRQDRDVLIADWVRTRLSQARTSRA
ncbi:MAG: alpha/beta fold hydrolase [Streptomyces sp.]|nr:alpha/beta fold hydrolase [Streptomyces sp.]